MLSLRNIVQALVDDDYSSQSSDAEAERSAAASQAGSVDSADVESSCAASSSDMAPAMAQPQTQPSPSTNGSVSSDSTQTSPQQPARSGTTSPAVSTTSRRTSASASVASSALVTIQADDTAAVQDTPASTPGTAPSTSCRQASSTADVSTTAQPDGTDRVQELEALVRGLREAMASTADLQAELRSRVADAEAEAVQAQARYKVAEAEARSKEDELAHVRSNCAALRAAVDQLQGKLASSRAQLDAAAVSQAAAASVDSSNAAAVADAEHRADAAQAAAQAAASEITRLRHACTVAEDRRDAMQLRVRALEDIISTWEPEAPAPAPASAQRPPISAPLSRPADTASNPPAESCNQAALRHTIQQQRLQIAHLQEQIRRAHASAHTSSPHAMRTPVIDDAGDSSPAPRQMISQLVVSALEASMIRGQAPSANGPLHVLASLLPFNPVQREQLRLDAPGIQQRKSVQDLSDAWLQFLQEETGQ